MAQHIIHSTGKLQDREIVRLISEIHEKFGGDHRRFSYGEIFVDDDEDVEELIGKGTSYSLSEAIITTDGRKFQVYYRRGTSGLRDNNQTDIHVRIPSPYFDEIIVEPGRNTQQQKSEPSPEECLNLEQIVAKYVSSHVPKSVDSGAKGAIDLLQKEMASLTAFHRKMLSDAEKQRSALEADYKKKHGNLETKVEKDRKAIEAFSKDENAKIASLRSELESAQKALDDRDHMHVRRELREKISSDIKNRVSATLLPKKTELLNWSIVVFALICAGAAGLFAYGNYEAFSELVRYRAGGDAPAIENISWLILAAAIRGSVASIVTLGFLIFALSWMKKTYLDNVKISNELQRYALDINRASWTIETIMEMTTKEGRILPDIWIEGACHGLFRNTDNEKSEITPLEAWGLF